MPAIAEGAGGYMNIGKAVGTWRPVCLNLHSLLDTLEHARHRVGGRVIHSLEEADKIQ